MSKVSAILAQRIIGILVGVGVELVTLRVTFFVTSLIISQSLLAEGPSSTVNLELTKQQALRGAADEMRLNNSEKKHFEEEALPANKAFIANFKQRPDGFDIQVDKKKLKNFLSFEPTDMAERESCFYVRREAGCTTCEKAVVDVLPALKKQLAQRDFILKPLTIERNTEDSVLTHETAFEYYLSKSKDFGCANFLFLDLSNFQSADLAEEEVKTKIQISWQIVSKKLQKIKTSVQTVQEPVVILVADLYASVADKLNIEKNISTIEKYLRVEGVYSYQSYLKFKESLLNLLPELTLEERMIEPGVFTFAMPETTNINELIKQIKALPFELNKTQVLRFSNEELVVQLK